MNTICTEQNTERQLDRLAAQRALYTQAKRIFAVHAFLSTAVAGGLSVASMSAPSVKPYAISWGLILAILDIFWLTPRQKRLREMAATVQESFDCDVLGLPWQRLKVGSPVDHDVIVEHAAAYRAKEPFLTSLRDWYPTDVCPMPLFLARLVCQQMNAWWDAKQRRRSGVLVLGGVVALLLVVLAIGIAQAMTVGDLLLTTLGPTSAGIILALRQYRENGDAAGRLEKLKGHAQDLWRRALGGATEAELSAQSRLLQDELFENRKRNVPVSDWFYVRTRGQHEVQMQRSAAELVSELEAARSSGSKRTRRQAPEDGHDAPTGLTGDAD